MKRNKTLRIAIVLLALVLVSAIGMAGTLARYVATLDSETVAVRAAFWNIDTDNLVFDDTLTLVAADGAIAARDWDEGGVDISAEDIIIAPGTELLLNVSFDIVNNSEVPAEIYVRNITPVGTAHAQIEFRLADVETATPGEYEAAWGTFDAWLAEVTPAVGDVVVLDTIAAGATLTGFDFEIEARWGFDVNAGFNTTATTAGSTAADMFGFTIQFGARQAAAPATP